MISNFVWRLVAVAGMLLVGAHAFAQEWTRFRGPNGSGLSDATSVPVKWNDDDYNWVADLPGVGHSSPVLWGERIFVTSGDEESGTRTLICLDAGDGRRLWEQTYDAAHHGKHKLNSFASATPVVDAERVYHCWATPEAFFVAALTHAGDEVWRADLGPFKSGHGYGVSPIVIDDLLIVPNEQQGDSSLVALDCRSGSIRWKVERDSKVTFSTPCVYQPPGRSPELIFTNYEYGISALAPRTGKLIWEIDVFDKSHIETSIASPVIAGDLVLGASGWLGHGYEIIAVRPEERNGKTEAEQVYRIDKSAPLCVTPLVYDELLFLWTDAGVVTCAEAATGQTVWRRRVGGNYYSSPVCVAGKLYNISTGGDVIVLTAAREYELLAKNQLGEPSHATPAVAGGVMYLRTFSKLYSLGKKRGG